MTTGEAQQDESTATDNVRFRIQKVVILHSTEHSPTVIVWRPCRLVWGIKFKYKLANCQYGYIKWPYPGNKSGYLQGLKISEMSSRRLGDEYSGRDQVARKGPAETVERKASEGEMASGFSATSIEVDRVWNVAAGAS